MQTNEQQVKAMQPMMDRPFEREFKKKHITLTTCPHDGSELVVAVHDDNTQIAECPTCGWTEVR